MTKEEAILRIKDYMTVHKMDEPRAIHISEALNMAIEALEKEPILEKDGTLVVTTEHYENVGRVLVQHGTSGTLFYKD
jgi:hypothetical protein